MILDQFIKSIADVRVLAIGDIMLDRYVYGQVSRISPEAPIPVLHQKKSTEMLGGVGNVLQNITTMGGKATYIGVVGKDDVGRQVTKLLKNEKLIESFFVEDKDFVTPLKTRFVATSQQVLRVDQEDVKPISQAIQEKILHHVKRHIQNMDILVISDYAKGVIVAELVQALMAIAKEADIPVLVDPKGHDYALYQHADIITPNRHELEVATRQKIDKIEDILAPSQMLIENYGLQNILTTCGEDGMVLTTAEGGFHHLPTKAKSVYDVTGAGDTVVAALACSIAAGLSLDTSMRIANYAAGVVVAKPGTSTVSLAELAQACDEGVSYQKEKEQKILTLEAAVKKVVSWRREGLKIGFTNGCFDVLHPGHLSLLSQARGHCDKLIVGLNADDSIKRLKGSSRPLQDQFTRSRILSSLQDIDLVVIFSDDTPIHLIEKISPDILIKGADYQNKEIVGADHVKKKGGEVLLAQIEQGFSTSGFIEKIHEKEKV